MNIQIFGKKKCFDTKKAQRFFKERRIKFQFIDIIDKGFSGGELKRILSKIKREDLISPTHELYKESGAEGVTDMALLSDILYDYYELVSTPVVRNGKDVTVGNTPEVWQSWIDRENDKI